MTTQEGPQPQPSTASRHLLDYARIIYKRRWTALAVWVLVLAATAAYVFTAVPVYEARTQLMIDIERPRVVLFKDTLEQDTDKADYQQTQHKILQSRALAERILDTLSLWKHPEFTEPNRSGLRGRIDGLVDMAGNAVGKISRSTPVAAKEEKGVAETRDRSRVIDQFLDRLTVEPVRNSRLVDVKFQATDPVLAAKVVNTLADAYMQQSLEFKTQSSKEASETLAAQLAEQRTKVEESQRKLQQYRESTNALSTSERESIVQQRLNELNGAVSKARTERTQKEFIAKQLAGYVASNNMQALLDAPTVQVHPLIVAAKTQLAEAQRNERELRDKVGERHPDLIRARNAVAAAQQRLEAEARKVAEASRADYQAALAQENTFVDSLETGKREAQELRRKQVEYDALERVAQADQQIFDSLLKSTKETGVTSEMLGTNIRVVDVADPPGSPISPRRARDMSVAAAIGLVLAMGFAISLEYLDKRLKTPEEVKARLGLPYLGLVPTIPKQPGHAEAPMLNNGVPAIYKEAFRGVRTSILFAAEDEPSHTILVTSASPNEGKSVVAANLAICLAQTGRRVLLVDGDMRRPTIHKMLDLEQEPGLAEVTNGKLASDTAIKKTSVKDLSVLAAGELPENPAELLSSPQFKSFLETSQKDYDWVIIDSPPVMAVTDASLIANAVGGVIFVVGAERTSGPLALNALERLHAAHARFVGVVLNQVDLERNSFFYADHYRREYRTYYHRGSQDKRVQSISPIPRT